MHSEYQCDEPNNDFLPLALQQIQERSPADLRIWVSRAGPFGTPSPVGTSGRRTVAGSRTYDYKRYFLPESGPTQYGNVDSDGFSRFVLG